MKKEKRSSSKKNLSSLKTLRSETGASIMACKKALEDARGDMAKARKYLEKHTTAVVEKIAQRQTHQGVIASYIHSTKRVGSMVEVRCETDFVANTQTFQDLASELALHITGMNPKDIEELLMQPYVRDPSRTIEVFLSEAVANLGERIQIVRFQRYEI